MTFWTVTVSNRRLDRPPQILGLFTSSALACEFIDFAAKNIYHRMDGWHYELAKGAKNYV